MRRLVGGGLALVVVLGVGAWLAVIGTADRPSAPAGPASSPPATSSPPALASPARASIGKGHVLEGVVTSGRDGRPVNRARLLLWLVAEDGEYHDDHRATIVTGPSGAYWFESNFPPSYGPEPHIHVRVSAPGFGTLETERLLTPGQPRTRFDLTLPPA